LGFTKETMGPSLASWWLGGLDFWHGIFSTNWVDIQATMMEKNGEKSYQTVW
jgi:hypothetical protein